MEPVVAQLEEVWSSLAAACEGLAPEEWDRPSGCPGWTVRDVVSHVTGTERTLLGEPTPEHPGELPPYVHNPIGRLNESWVAAARRRSGDEVLADLRAVTGRRLAELGRMEAARWEAVGPSPVGDVPYREFMDVRVMDCWVHEQDVRRAVGRPGGRGGAGESVTLRRMSGAMGLVVGRRAGAGEGTSVVWEIEGRGAVAVGVRGGRGQLLGEAPAHPTVRLRLDADSFWRLACGRPGAGHVDVEGDPDLARRVLESMNVMI